MKDSRLLNQVQDEVFADPALQPHDDTTYCNIASQRVARGMGCREFDGSGSEPYTADQMHALIRSSPKFLIKPMADCQDLANAGALIFAILPASKLNQGHGHVCTLTTGQAQFSGHWDAKAPQAMNLGRVGTCFRRNGVNFAFVPQPEYYAWVESL